MDFKECLIQPTVTEAHFIYCHVERDLRMMVLFLSWLCFPPETVPMVWRRLRNGCPAFTVWLWDQVWGGRMCLWRMPRREKQYFENVLLLLCGILVNTNMQCKKHRYLFFLKMHFFLNHFYSSIVDLKAVHTKNNNCSDNYNDMASHTSIFYFRIQPCILKLVERKWCWRSLNVMFIGSFMWSLHFCHTAMCIRKREKCPHLCKLRQSFWKVYF